MCIVLCSCLILQQQYSGDMLAFSLLFQNTLLASKKNDLLEHEANRSITKKHILQDFLDDWFILKVKLLGTLGDLILPLSWRTTTLLPNEISQNWGKKKDYVTCFKWRHPSCLPLFPLVSIELNMRRKKHMACFSLSIKSSAFPDASKRHK